MEKIEMPCILQREKFSCMYIQLKKQKSIKCIPLER